MFRALEFNRKETVALVEEGTRSISQVCADLGFADSLGGAMTSEPLRRLSRQTRESGMFARFGHDLENGTDSSMAPTEHALARIERLLHLLLQVSERDHCVRPSRVGYQDEALLQEQSSKSHLTSSPKHQVDRRHAAAPELKRPLIVDRPGVHRNRLAEEFRKAGHDVAEVNVQDAPEALTEHRPDLIVMELRFERDCREGCALLMRLRECLPDVPIAVLSDSLSISTAVWAVRSGARAVLPKPASAAQILSAVTGDSELPARAEEPRHFTLDRATWEYISQTVHECKSIAGAARRLGIQPRSLRRMLLKNPPRW